MLSFCTEFPVDEGGAEKFRASVAKWLGESPHSDLAFDEVFALSATNSGYLQRGNFELSCIAVECEGRTAAGFKYNLRDDGVDWSTTVCFDSNEVDSWVSVRTERHALEAVPFLPEAKKPLVVRNLMAGLGGGVDGELRVLDAPHLLSDRDVDMVVRLLNGDSDHHLPIVYVSCPFSGQLSVNVEALASHLGGVAHVLVEPNREFSRSIQRGVFSENPYGGFIGVYYSSQDLVKLSPSLYATEFMLRRDIFENVSRALLHRRPLSRCNWANLQAELSSQERKDLRENGSEEVLEYAAMFDKEMEAKDLQLAEAEHEINRLKSSLLDIGKRTKSVVGGVNLSVGGEQQFTSDEFLEVVLDAIKARKDSETGRRKHIIEAIISSNESEGRLAKKRDEIKSILKGYTNLTAGIRAALCEMGFDILEEGKHYKLIYKGDGRYTFILAKSGSDHRGGINAATQIARDIF